MSIPYQDQNSDLINRKNGRPTFLLVQEKYKDKELQSVTIEVNFCPWCGRYLRGTYDGK